MSEFDQCLTALRQASEQYEFLTTDDFWPLLGFQPRERNNVGKAFSEANRLGWIKGTEQFVRSKRPEAKGRRVQLWQSMLWEVSK